MKLGIVGTGKMTKEALPVLKKCGWEILTICSTPRSISAAEALCKAYEIPAFYCDFCSMLSEIQMDAVYIAVPNFQHFFLARQALEAGVNVIVEKPLTSSLKEAKELAELAQTKGLFLFEAISTVYLPNYQRIKSLLPKIGQVKLVSCNFSQYSSRYNSFLAGETPSVFDPAKSGGALMDLNSYHLHYLVGLFGTPAELVYHANIERDIDTSGVLHLDYGSFQAVCIAAKDCSLPPYCAIQGTKGYLAQHTTANICGAVTLHLNDGTEEIYDENPSNRLEPEFRTFAEIIRSGNLDAFQHMLVHSVSVAGLLTRARETASIHFPADNLT